MADGRHFKNHFWPQLSSRLSDFSAILHYKAEWHDDRGHVT